MFGKPNEGVHAYRFLGIAIVDLGLTIIGAYIISLVFGYSFWKTLLGLLIIATIAHILFCVDTAFIRFLRSLPGMKQLTSSPPITKKSAI